jgi:hypothetical protein
MKHVRSGRIKRRLDSEVTTHVREGRMENFDIDRTLDRQRLLTELNLKRPLPVVRCSLAFDSCVHSQL